MTAKKILVVEDDLMLRQAYEIVLHTAGYRVALSSNGQEALQKIKEEKFDLILLDLLMPEVDGWGFLEKANIKKKWPDVKVIIFSNLSSIEKINDALSLGGDIHLVKSNLSPKQLIQSVQDLLKNHRKSSDS